MFSDPAVRKSIFAGIITSILVILFIQPILGLIGKVMNWLGTNLYEGFSNSLYRQAALGLNERYSFILLGLFHSSMIGLLTGATIAIIIFRREEEKKTSFDGDKIIKKILFNRIVIPIILIVTIFCSFTTLTDSFASLQMNASFNQRLTIIAPSLSDNEEKALKAQWASMRNRRDYEVIVSFIEKIANDKKIELPKLLWK